MRQTLKINKSKKPMNIYSGLKINQSKLPIYNSHMLELLHKYKQMHEVIKDLWDDPQWTDNEVIIMIMGLGRQQAQADVMKQTKDMLGQAMASYARMVQ